MDIFPNEDADANVVLTPTESWTEQEKEVYKDKQKASQNYYQFYDCKYS